MSAITWDPLGRMGQKLSKQIAALEKCQAAIRKTRADILAYKKKNKGVEMWGRKPRHHMEAMCTHILFVSGSVGVSAKKYGVSSSTASEKLKAFCALKFPSETKQALGARYSFDRPSIERMGALIARKEASS